VEDDDASERVPDHGRRHGILPSGDGRDAIRERPEARDGRKRLGPAVPR
jgi:hypothetical protein